MHGVGGFASDGVDEVGGMGVSEWRDVGGGRGCCVSCMHLSMSGGVSEADVVGEVVVGGGCIQGKGFQALHCRRLS
jgi:hypothetical protein